MNGFLPSSTRDVSIDCLSSMTRCGVSFEFRMRATHLSQNDQLSYLVSIVLGNPDARRSAQSVYTAMAPASCNS